MTAGRDEDDAVREAATRARMVWQRVAGSGDGSSWLDQIEVGDVLTGKWPPGRAQEVAELLAAVAEQLRHVREVGAPGHAEPHAEAGSAFVAATHQRLPMNRKERYFTGTVLPGLVGDNGFAHLHRLLALCGLSDVAAECREAGSRSGGQDVQVFTEYGFAESVYTHKDKQRLDDRPLERDTPDLVLMGPDWLLAIEAKMYHRATRNALARQAIRQKVIVEYWTRRFHLSSDRVAHVLLLPDGLATARKPLPLPLVTWEQIRDAYSVVGAAYWYGVLRSALDRYDELASPEPTFRGNADELLTGEDIVKGHAGGTLPYEWVGCQGGLNGKLLAEDIAAARWREREYEVRVDALPGNHNWFSVAQFVALTASS
jgi:hypothetical protein